MPFAFLPFCSFVGDPQSLLAGFLVGWVRYFRSRRASWVVLGLFWLALPIEVSLSFFAPARTCGGPRCTWHQTLFWRTNLTCEMVSAGRELQPKAQQIGESCIECWVTFPCLRPYSRERTVSRPNCEVKSVQVILVLRWGTTWESVML